MLARALGQPLEDYLRPGSPVQEAIASTVSHFCAVAREALVQGIDGCSAPNYAVPLRSLALAFARLSLESTDRTYSSTAHRVAKAMSRHPELVSGEGRNDLILMRAGRGDWFSKVGADGVQALGIFSRGVGVAAKCSDGQLVPLMVALVTALEQLGWLDEASRSVLATLMPPPMRNVAGLEVGEMTAVWQLTMAA